MSDYVNLTPEQIERLMAQGCRADNWPDVLVDRAFDASAVHGCAFRGRVEIGRGAALSDARLRNVRIGDGVRIEGVALIECTGESSFGVGVPVAAVNEGGGREVPLHPTMTAQTAYLMAMYRHRKATVAKLSEITEQERAAARDTLCTLGPGAVITGCGVLRDVNIGASARLEGVQHLENGTVLSATDAPAHVGHGVRAVDFLFARSSRVESGASLRRCFVGQGCHIEEGFTAIDSLFFANSVMAAGEAVSIFAGPYTVSHHKSTLLIAGLFSFFNAGSGANQSNHLFKTGAVHQGINERGCKYGSNAYVMLPARTGAFNTVLGRHSSHHDSSVFPYSYILEEEGRSWLMPGAVLRSWGTVRDLRKWPARDARQGGADDLVNFEEHNPYIAARIARGLDAAEKLLADAGRESYTYNRLKIRQTMLRRGRDLYRLALDASLGAMAEAGGPKDGPGRGEWVDLAGMYAPQELIEHLLDDIDNGAHRDMLSVRRALEEVHARFKDYAYVWTLSQTDQNLADLTERGATARQTLYNYALEDSAKDAAGLMATGYGIDSRDPQVVAADFEAVRGVPLK